MIPTNFPPQRTLMAPVEGAHLSFFMTFPNSLELKLKLLEALSPVNFSVFLKVLPKS